MDDIDIGFSDDFDITETDEESPAERAERECTESAGGCISNGKSISEAIGYGHSLSSCFSAGYTVEDAYNAGISADACKEAGASAEACFRAGYSAEQMRGGGYSSVAIAVAAIINYINPVSNTKSTTTPPPVRSMTNNTTASKFICNKPVKDLKNQQYVDSEGKTQCVQIVKSCGLVTSTSKWEFSAKPLSKMDINEIPPGTPICTVAKDGTYGHPHSEKGANNGGIIDGKTAYGHCGIFNIQDGKPTILDQFVDKDGNNTPVHERQLTVDHKNWRYNINNYYTIIGEKS